VKLRENSSRFLKLSPKSTINFFTPLSVTDEQLKRIISFKFLCFYNVKLRWSSRRFLQPIPTAVANPFKPLSVIFEHLNVRLE